MTAGLNNNAEATAEPVPSGLKLFSHQEEGVRFAINRLRTNRGAMFGDIMGLGKTIEAIVTANAMVPHRILVVCPASVLFTWRREIWKWQTLGLPVWTRRSIMGSSGGVSTARRQGWRCAGKSGGRRCRGGARYQCRALPRRSRTPRCRVFPGKDPALDLRDGLVSPVASGATENCRSSRLSTVVAVNCRPRAERYARVAPRRTQ